MDTDGNVEVDIDTDNGDAIDDIKDEDENDVDVVNNHMDTDGNVKVDIDTDNDDAIDIKDEDDNENENDDNNDDEEEAQRFINKEKIILKIFFAPLGMFYELI